MLNLPEFNEILKEENEHYYRFTVEKKFGGKFDDIEPIVVIKNEPEFVSTGVDITTLSEILNKGDF